jgi:hypothetical protein
VRDRTAARLAAVLAHRFAPAYAAGRELPLPDAAALALGDPQPPPEPGATLVPAPS